MREAAELAWQRPSGLGVGGGRDTCISMWAWARAGMWLAPPWGTCFRALQELLGWHRVSVDNGETVGAHVHTPKTWGGGGHRRGPWQDPAAHSLHSRA